MCRVKTFCLLVLVLLVIQIVGIFIWYIKSTRSLRYSTQTVPAVLTTSEIPYIKNQHYIQVPPQSNSSNNYVIPQHVDRETPQLEGAVPPSSHESTLIPQLPKSISSDVAMQNYVNTHKLPLLSGGNSPVLVIGTSTLIGSHVVKYFHDNSIPVVATDDSINIEPDPMMWYRWEKLSKLSSSRPQFKNYSDHDITLTDLKKINPKTVVYIPSPCFSSYNHDKLTSIKQQLENFLLLLEINRKESNMFSVVLITPSTTKVATSLSEICKHFDNSLSFYRNIHNINSVVIKPTKVYGPWESPIPDMKPSSCFVGDLVTFVGGIVLVPHQMKVESMLNSFTCNSSQYPLAVSIINRWAEEYDTYKKLQNKDIVASSYFTTKRNAQYPIEFINNNYYFMENWFKNIYKMNLNMMVLHDDLSDKFTKTFQRNYPKADFIRITDFMDYRPNDRRFLGYFDYILAHPEIRRIVMTDMRDLVIQNNPFEVMEVVGDYAYVGTDRPFKETVGVSDMLFVFRRCYQHTKVPLDYHSEIKLLGFLNAGVIGGSRHIMLTFLTRFLLYFQISNKDNCNMAIAEIIFHKFLFDRLYFGWPINAAFITDQPNIPGLAVLHKWTLESYN